jgi:hypothetical protein
LDIGRGTKNLHGGLDGSLWCGTVSGIAPATSNDQPGSAGLVGEHLEVVPGWSLLAAAGPEFQPVPADKGLGRRIGEVFPDRL